MKVENTETNTLIGSLACLMYIEILLENQSHKKIDWKTLHVPRTHYWSSPEFCLIKTKHFQYNLSFNSLWYVKLFPPLYTKCHEICIVILILWYKVSYFQFLQDDKVVLGRPNLKWRETGYSKFIVFVCRKDHLFAKKFHYENERNLNLYFKTNSVWEIK